ncbi:MAG TPA: HEAT repeat domain-containing protein, partial [Bacillota bacterium]|nr:HEAT repeat domain-containing protein [Bacillota bacterium]
RALQDNDSQIRRRICKLLGEIGNPQVTEALIVALKDEEAGVRYESAEALRKLKDTDSILPLISALNDPNQDVQAVAIMALGNFGDERAVEPLVAMLIEQKEHRHACLEALRNICGDENLEPLFDLIRTSKKMITDTSNLILENLYLRHKKPLEASNA